MGSGCSQLSAYAARGKVAEGEGFEPPLGCPKPVFKGKRPVTVFALSLNPIAGMRA